MEKEDIRKAEELANELSVLLAGKRTPLHIAYWTFCLLKAQSTHAFEDHSLEAYERAEMMIRNHMLDEMKYNERIGGLVLGDPVKKRRE